MSSVWEAISRVERSLSAGTVISSGVRLTATMGCPGNIFFASNTGRFALSPPSTSSFPFIFHGSNIPGIEMDARRADARLPSRSTTVSPFSRFVATAAKGIGRLLKSVAVTRDVSSLKKA